MIIPLVREEVWQSTLGNLPPFEVPTKRILFISPHPDDEILAAGAFLAAQQKHGIEIAIIAVTDGENAYPENAGLGELRRCEQEAALGQHQRPRAGAQPHAPPCTRLASAHQRRYGGVRGIARNSGQ